MDLFYLYITHSKKWIPVTLCSAGSLLGVKFTDSSLQVYNLPYNKISTRLAHFYEHISFYSDPAHKMNSSVTPLSNSISLSTNIWPIQHHPILSPYFTQLTPTSSPFNHHHPPTYSSLQLSSPSIFSTTTPVSIYPIVPNNSTTGQNNIFSNHQNNPQNNPQSDPQNISSQQNASHQSQPPSTLPIQLTPIYHSTANQPADYNSSSSLFHSASDGEEGDPFGLVHDDSNISPDLSAGNAVLSNRPSLHQAASQHSSSTQQSHHSNRPTLRPTNSARFNQFNQFQDGMQTDQILTTPQQTQLHTQSSVSTSVSTSSTSPNQLNPQAQPQAAMYSPEPRSSRVLSSHHQSAFKPSQQQKKHLTSSHSSTSSQFAHHLEPHFQTSHLKQSPMSSNQTLSTPMPLDSDDIIPPISAVVDSSHRFRTSSQLVASPPVHHITSLLDHTTVSIDEFHTSHGYYNQATEMLFDPYWIKDDDSELLPDSRFVSTTAPRCQNITRYCPHLIDIATQMNTKLNFLGGLATSQYFSSLSTMAFNAIGPEVYVGGDPLSEAELFTLRERKLAKKQAQSEQQQQSSNQPQPNPPSSSSFAHSSSSFSPSKQGLVNSNPNNPNCGNYPITNTNTNNPHSFHQPSLSLQRSAGLKLQPSQQELKQLQLPNNPNNTRPAYLGNGMPDEEEQSDALMDLRLDLPNNTSYTSVGQYGSNNLNVSTDFDDSTSSQTSSNTQPAIKQPGQTGLLQPIPMPSSPHHQSAVSTTNSFHIPNNNSYAAYAVNDEDSSENRGSLHQLSTLRQSQILSPRIPPSSHQLTASTAALLSPMRTSFTSHISTSTATTTFSTLGNHISSVRYDASYGPSTHFLYRQEEFLPIRKPSSRVRTRVKNYTIEQHPNAKLSAIDSTTFKCIAAGMANGYFEDCYESYSLPYHDSQLILRYGSQTALATHYNTMTNTTTPNNFSPSNNNTSSPPAQINISGLPTNSLEHSYSSLDPPHPTSTYTFPACCYTSHSFSLYVPSIIVGAVDFSTATDHNTGRVRQHLLNNRAMYCTCKNTYRDKASIASNISFNSTQRGGTGFISPTNSNTKTMPNPFLSPNNPVELTSPAPVGQMIPSASTKSRLGSAKEELCEHCELYRKHVATYGKFFASGSDDDESERSTDYLASDTDFSEFQSLTSRSGSTSELHQSPAQQTNSILSQHNSTQDQPQPISPTARNRGGSLTHVNEQIFHAGNTAGNNTSTSNKPGQSSLNFSSPGLVPLIIHGSDETPQLQQQLSNISHNYSPDQVLPLNSIAGGCSSTPSLLNPSLPPQAQAQLYSSLKTSPNYIPKERRKLPSLSTWHYLRCQEILGLLDQHNRKKDKDGQDSESNNSSKFTAKPGQNSPPVALSHTNALETGSASASSHQRTSLSQHGALFKPRDSYSQSRMSSKHEDGTHRSSLNQLDGISPAMYRKTSRELGESADASGDLDRDMTLLDSTAANSSYQRDREHIYGPNTQNHPPPSQNPQNRSLTNTLAQGRRRSSIDPSAARRRSSIEPSSVNSPRNIPSNNAPNELSSSATGATPSSARLGIKDSDFGTQGLVSLRLSSKRDSGPQLLFTMNEDEEDDDSNSDDDDHHDDKKKLAPNIIGTNNHVNEPVTPSHLSPDSTSSTIPLIKSLQVKGEQNPEHVVANKYEDEEIHPRHRSKRTSHVRLFLIATDIETAFDLKQTHEKAFFDFAKTIYDYGNLPFKCPPYESVNLLISTSKFARCPIATKTHLTPNTHSTHFSPNRLFDTSSASQSLQESATDSFSYDLSSNHSQFNPVGGLTPFQLQLMQSSLDNGSPNNPLYNIELQLTIESEIISHQTTFLQQDQLRELHNRFYIPPHLLQKEEKEPQLTAKQLKEQRRKERIKEQRQKQKEIESALAQKSRVQGAGPVSLRQTRDTLTKKQSDPVSVSPKGNQNVSLTTPILLTSPSSSGSTDNPPNSTDSPNPSPCAPGIGAGTGVVTTLGPTLSGHSGSAQSTQPTNKPPLLQYALYIPLTNEEVSPDPDLFKIRLLSSLDKRFCRAVQKFVLQTLEIIPDKQRHELLKKMITIGKYNHYTFLQLGYIHKAREEFKIEITNMNARDVEYILILDDDYLPYNLRSILFPHDLPTASSSKGQTKQSGSPKNGALPAPITTTQQDKQGDQLRHNLSASSHSDPTNVSNEGPSRDTAHKSRGIHSHPPLVDEIIASVQSDVKEVGQYHITNNINNPNTLKGCSPEDVIKYYAQASPWQNVDFSYLNKISLAEMINLALGVAVPGGLLRATQNLLVEFDLGPTIPFPHHPHHLHPYYCPFSALLNDQPIIGVTGDNGDNHISFKPLFNMPHNNSTDRQLGQQGSQSWATSHIFKHVLRFGINYKCFDNQNNLSDIIWLVRPKTNAVTRGIGKAFSFFAKSFGMKKDWSKLKVDGEAAILTFEDFNYRKRNFQEINDQIVLAQASNQDTSQLEFERRMFLLFQSMDFTYSPGHPIVPADTTAQRAASLYAQMQADIAADKLQQMTDADPVAALNPEKTLTPAPLTSKRASIGKIDEEKKKIVTKFLRFSNKVDVNSVNDKPRFKYTGTVSNDGLRKGGTNAPSGRLRSSFGDSYIYTVPIDINLHQLFTQSFVLQTPEEQGMGMNYVCYKKLLEGLPFAVVPRGRLPLHEKTYDGFGLSTILKQQSRYRVPNIPFSLLSSHRVLTQLVESSNDGVLLRRKKDIKLQRQQRRQQHHQQHQSHYDEEEE